MVTRKPVPSGAVLLPGRRTSNDRPYVASSDSNQQAVPRPRRSKSPTASPSFYEMDDAWADEASDRQKLAGNSGSRRSVVDRRGSVGETRVQAESLPSSLRTGPPEAKQRTVEEDKRFKTSRLSAGLPSTAAAGDKQRFPEEPGDGTNPFDGPSRDPNIWQSIGSGDESLANIWWEMEASPAPSSKALPPPPLVENRTGVLASIRAFPNADIVTVS
jgi:hypothetical protein